MWPVNQTVYYPQSRWCRTPIRAFVHPNYEACVHRKVPRAPYYYPEVRLHSECIVTRSTDLLGLPDHIHKSFVTGTTSVGTSIYTDGSKSYYGVGAAFFVPDFNYYHKFTLPYETTIFNAESLAIEEALKHVFVKNWKHTVLFSDSLNVLTEIKYNPRTNHQLILRINDLINSLLSDGKVVYLLWVKAHSGNVYNDEVDRLAKEASAGVFWSSTFGFIPKSTNGEEVSRNSGSSEQEEVHPVIKDLGAVMIPREYLFVHTWIINFNQLYPIYEWNLHIADSWYILYPVAHSWFGTVYPQNYLYGQVRVGRVPIVDSVEESTDENNNQ